MALRLVCISCCLLFLQNRRSLPRLLAGPVDEGLRLGVLAIGQGGDVVTLGTAHRHVREGGHQLAPCQPLAHQILAPHGDPGVVHGGDDGEIGAIKPHAGPTCRKRNAGLLGPAGPLVAVGVMAPGLPIVQQAAVRQVGRVAEQAVPFGILRAAHRHHVLVHQRMDGEPGRRLVVEIEGEIDAVTMQIDVLVAGHDVELDLGMQAGEIRQPRHQPALGDGGARVDGQGTRQLLMADLQDLLVDELQR